MVLFESAGQLDTLCSLLSTAAVACAAACCRYGPMLRDKDPDAFEQMRLVVGYYDLPQVC
jgi:hypothetical protein